MSVLKWLWNSRFLIKKNAAPILSARTYCTGPTETPQTTETPVSPESKPYKRGSDLFILPAEREKVPLETKLRYLKSQAYKKTYGDLPVWTIYVRNFKGGFAPKPRRTCIFLKKLTSRNPCPICRDKYLIADYRNVDLLKQFISPHGGEIISNRKTGVCQKQHFNLLVAIKKARNIGSLSFPVPFRRYDYSAYTKESYN